MTDTVMTYCWTVVIYRRKKPLARSGREFFVAVWKVFFFLPKFDASL